MPILTPNAFTYLGGFRVPQGYIDSGHTPSLGNAIYTHGGGRGLAFNPNGNGGLGSVFMYCHTVGDPGEFKMVELAIPTLHTPTSNSDFGSLEVAPILQPAYDPSGGGVSIDAPTTGDFPGGILVIGGKLLHSNYQNYPREGYQQYGFWKHSNTTLTGTASAGPYELGDHNPLLGGVAQNMGFYTGYMGHITSDWQADFGGDMFVGQGNPSILARTSSGGAIFSYDSTKYGVDATDPIPLVYYPESHLPWYAYNVPAGLHEDNCPVANRRTNPYWTQCTKFNAVVMVPDTDSVLVFGSHGIGGYAYGQGTADPALDGVPYNATGEVYVLDPADQTKGPHAYPYVPACFSYLCSDLLAVKNGTKNPWDVLPTVIPLDLPFDGYYLRNDIDGACYDTVNNRLYISQINVEGGTYPVIQAFSLNPDAGEPASDPALMWLESGGDASRYFEFYDTTPSNLLGDYAIDETVSHTGPCSIRLTRSTVPSSIVNYLSFVATGYDGADGTRLSFWYRFNQWPEAQVNTVLLLTTLGATAFRVAFEPDGTVTLAAPGATSVTGSTVMQPGTWYRIAICGTITDATHFRFDVYIGTDYQEGQLQGSLTAGTLTNTDISGFKFAVGITAGPGFKAWFDDVYLDKGSDYTDPGNIRVTNKRPAALSTNTFDTPIGNNPANRWENVNESPFNILNGWQQAATSNTAETYLLEGASEGDVDITGYPIVARGTWVWSEVDTMGAGSAKVFDDGTEYADTPEEFPALDFLCSPPGLTPTVYPTGAFGMRAPNNASDIYLYEVGCLLAYKPPLQGLPDSITFIGDMNTAIIKFLGQYYGAPIIDVNQALQRYLREDLSGDVQNQWQRLFRRARGDNS